MHVWRERLRRWFDPMARACPLSPNAISGIALAMSGVAAATIAAGRHYPVAFLVAPVLVTIAGLLDAFDGIVARAQHKESRFGDFLDHIFDRVSDTVLVIGWILGTGVRLPLAMAALATTLLHSYIGTQVEASFGVRSYVGPGRGEFVIGMVALPIYAFTLARAGILEQRYNGLSIPEWMTAVLSVLAVFFAVGRIRSALRVADRDSDDA